MEREIAIIMAAGMGTRLWPVTEKIPKPLIPVHGTPMVETILAGLRLRGIPKIYLVTGYKKEQFAYLAEKYKEVELVENREYAVKNNISSLMAAGEHLGSANCFICEADLYIPDGRVFLSPHKKSCYYGKMKEGTTDDWAFHVKDGRIIWIGKGGESLYNMAGVSYWLKEEAGMIGSKIREAYEKKGYEQLYWDEIVQENIRELDVRIHPIDPEDILEIDTLEELKEVDQEYKEISVLET